MNCYTRKGDQGKTSIFNKRTDKHDVRIEAIGVIDELNAFLGLSSSFSKNKSIKAIIYEISNDLFSVGAELAGAKVRITANHVKRLEIFIEKIYRQLPKQAKFIIPRGTTAATLLNVARVTARCAERRIVTLDREKSVNAELLRYVNRLSSLLHILSRFENITAKIAEKNPTYNEMRIL